MTKRRTWYAKVNAALEERRWSKGEFARRAGVDAVSVRRWLRGANEPPRSVVSRLAAALGWPPAYLLVDTDPTEAEKAGRAFATLTGDQQKVIAAAMENGDVLVYLAKQLETYDAMRGRGRPDTSASR